MNMHRTWSEKTGKDLPTPKVGPGRSDRLVAALDIGTTKICCMIARIKTDGRIHVIGIGHRLARGIKAGAIVDMDLAETSIRAAVDQAEKLAGETMDHVVVSLNAGQPLSKIIEMDVEVDGHTIEQGDIDRLLGAAAGRIETGDRQILHAFPACFAIDGNMGVRHPIGMFGEQLSVALHVISVQPGPARNIETCVSRGHLGIEGLIVAPYASGLSTLVEDELNLGSAVVDLGGGTTSLGVFAGGALVHSVIIPMGGADITRDIARELVTPMEQAERLKTLFGSAVTVRSDDQEAIDVLRLGESENDEDSYARMPRSALTSIVQPRLEKIFTKVAQELRSIGFDGAMGRRVVLTGGGSQMPGVRELAQRTLARHVRLGRPQGIIGLPDTAKGPAFATCAGLLHYVANAPAEIGDTAPSEVSRKQPKSTLGKVGMWLKENF